MTDAISIRRATLNDVPAILYQRSAMFAEMGAGTPEEIHRMEIAFEPWLRRKMADDLYLGWFAVTDTGERAAGAGLWLMDWPPTVIEYNVRRAYMLNVYTYPPYRKRGLAHRLTETVIDWCRTNGYHLLLLHASDAGRPVYESLGFEVSSEMKLRI